MLFPSGRHAISVTISSTFVSCFVSPPVASTTKTLSRSPSRFEVNAILRPMKPCYWGRSVGTKSHLVPGLLRIHVAERRDPSHHGRRRCVSSPRTRAPRRPEDLRPFEGAVDDPVRICRATRVDRAVRGAGGKRGDEHRRSGRLAPRGPKSRHGSRERHVPRLSSVVHLRPPRTGQP